MNKFVLIFLLLVVLFQSAVHAKKQRRCPRGKAGKRCRRRWQNRTPSPTLQPLPTPKPTVDKSLPFIEPPYDLIEVPVHVHIIYKNSSGKVWGNVTTEMVENQINVLNRAFSGEEAIKQGYTVPPQHHPDIQDSQTRTRLFLESGLSFSLRGITRYENSFFNDPTVDWWWLCTLYNHSQQIMEKIGKKDHLNIYVCDASVSLGMAYFPWNMPPPKRGVFLHYKTLPGGIHKKYHQGKMGVHEVGHHYGLIHPYKNGCLANLPDDLVEDTPRMQGNPRPEKCFKQPQNTCPKLPGKDPTSNYMLAMPDQCRYHFTAGQVRRMRQIQKKYNVL